MSYIRILWLLMAVLLSAAGPVFAEDEVYAADQAPSDPTQIAPLALATPWNTSLRYAHSSEMTNGDRKGAKETRISYYDDIGKKVAEQKVEVSEEGLIRSKHFLEFDSAPEGEEKESTAFTQRETYIWDDRWLDHIYIVSCRHDDCHARLEDYEKGEHVETIPIN